MQTKGESWVLRFFVLVFVLPIPFWILGFQYPTQLLPGLPLSALGAFNPAVAALLLTYREDRLSGVLQLLERAFDVKRVKNKSWLLVALLINPRRGLITLFIALIISSHRGL